MKMPWFNLEGPARLLAVSATVFLGAASLCGIQCVIASFHQNQFDDLLVISSIIGLIEVGIMGLSFAVGALALLWMIASRMFSGHLQPNAPQSAVRRFHASARNNSKVA